MITITPSPELPSSTELLIPAPPLLLDDETIIADDNSDDESELRDDASSNDSEASGDQPPDCGHIVSKCEEWIQNLQAANSNRLISYGLPNPHNYHELYDTSWLDSETVLEIIRLWDHKSAVSGTTLKFSDVRLIKWNPEHPSRPSNVLPCSVRESAEHLLSIKMNNGRAPYAPSIMNKIVSRAKLFANPSQCAGAWEPVCKLIRDDGRRNPAAPKRKRTPQHDLGVSGRHLCAKLRRPSILGQHSRAAETARPAVCDGTTTSRTRTRKPSRRAVEARADSGASPRPNEHPSSSAEPQAAGNQLHPSLSVAFDEMRDGLRVIICRMRAATETMVALEEGVGDIHQAFGNIRRIISHSMRV